MTRLKEDSALLDAVQRIGRDVAGPAADSVDREARFPREAITALREERLLSVLVPKELGGAGATIAEVGVACETLGRACSSTAMIFAMHQIEVACLVRHALHAPFFSRYLAGLVEHQWLIASATSEIGTGGDLRRSVCAVERSGTRITIRKQAPVISYGEDADDILLTARRETSAAPGDQVLVLLRKPETRLTKTGEWDALGMRGTRSLGFTLDAEGGAQQILPVPFADIASQTMLPTSHVLWASLWLGLASDAVGRARAFVRAEARRSPGTTPPGALRLAEVVAELGCMRATVHEGRRDFERLEDDADGLAGLGFTIRMNNLKLTASQMAAGIVGRALGVCGVSGYRCDSPYTVGRHLRDAHSAALMISNDRIAQTNAAMLLLHKED